MPFPEFSPNKKKVLFFSRGRGRGHALPDIEIAKELLSLRSDIEIRFVSYSTGARTIEQAGLPLIDVDLPAPGDDVRMTALSGRLINWLKPDLVVSHEEFCVLPVAKIFDRPTILLLEWFIDPQEPWMRTLLFADQILFIEESGLFEEPPWVEGKVKYVGRLIRKFTYGPQDRRRAREELQISEAAFVVSFFPGAFATEERSPMADLLIAAFDELTEERKMLVWVAGEDRNLIKGKLGNRTDAMAIETAEPHERLMVASNIGVTKGNRGSTIDLVALGTPVVAITHGQNPIDDKITATLDGAVQLKAADVQPTELAQVLMTQAKRILQSRDPTDKVVPTCASRISQKCPGR